MLREAELERDWVDELDGTKTMEELIADFSAFMATEIAAQP